MARRDTQFIQGAYYHIYNRGANRTSIFLDEADFLDTLKRMKEYAARFSIAIIAYCLMPNHYHWLVRQDGLTEARLLPQRVFNGYVKAFNRRHQRTGTLFESEFKANPVEEDGYLRHLCRYIHINPVKDGFTTAPELWPYSNYLEWIKARNGTLVDRQFIDEFFPDMYKYQQYVQDYFGQRKSAKEKEFDLYIAQFEK